MTITGPDAPGITALLSDMIHQAHLRLSDIEQVVVQGHLTLVCSVAVEEPDGAAAALALLKDVLFATKTRGLELHYVFSEPQQDFPRRSPYVITLLGDIRAEVVYTLATLLSSHEINIDKIGKLSVGPLDALELVVDLASARVSSSSHHTTEQRILYLKQQLIELSQKLGVDMALQPESYARRHKRLVVFDMDSTLIQGEVIDELARAHDVYTEVAVVTAQAMNGKMPFEESLRRRVHSLKGLSLSKVEQVVEALPLMSGARRTMKILHRLGYQTALISGGFTVAAQRVQKQLGLHSVHANILAHKDGYLTGEVDGEIIGPQTKADRLKMLAQVGYIPMEQTVAVGDGANDIPMLQAAGLGIAFHAKPVVREQATTSIQHGGLDRLLYLLGLHHQDIEDIEKHF